MKALLEQYYKGVFEPELLKSITEVGILKTFKAQELIMDYGMPISYMPLVIDGAIKIAREDNDDKEIVLYFIEAGDTCAVTLNCSLSTAKSAIRATAETDATLVMVPIAYMSKWMKTYESWQKYILQSYQERLNEMFDTIDTLAFDNMNDRLYKYLKNKAQVNHSTEVITTHNEIATDLNTSRVVVSRLLKALEREGKLTLHRNSISLTAM